MEYVIGVILFIIVVIIVGLLYRKRMYDNVDRLESWKIDIMNRNIASELSRMKELNLTGETLENFEKWTSRWELIVTDELAEIEIKLFDSESSIDRYKFKEARKTLDEAGEKLLQIESELDSIISELTELLETEESSRKSAEELLPTIKEMEKTLLQNRFLYDRATLRFEVELEELNNSLIAYNDLVENGEYHQAKEIIDKVNLEIKEVEEEIQEFPDIYKMCKSELPEQLMNLNKGIQEMKTDGYPVEHLGFYEDIQKHQQHLLVCVETLETKGTEDVKAVIPKIENSVKKMYDLLEKEVIAKNYIDTKLPNYTRELESFMSTFETTNEDIKVLKETYYFEDKDLEQILTFEKRVEELNVQYDNFVNQVKEKAETLSKLRAQLEGNFNNLEQLRNDHKAFKEHIDMLRKDELEARDQLVLLQEKLETSTRKLRMNNLPGIPKFILKRIDEAKTKITFVTEELTSQPLDINRIQKTLSEANTAVERAVEEVDILIEQAFLTEQVIQYANRYRSTNQELANSLKKSEDLFRKNDYELALEEAAQAIEKVEPGALKKIEEQQQYM